LLRKVVWKLLGMTLEVCDLTGVACSSYPRKLINSLNSSHNIFKSFFFFSFEMSASKSIILTGASRGIGLAIAHYLLRESHKVFLVARSGEPLEKLKAQYPGQVEYIAADITDFSVRGLLIVNYLFFAAARCCVLLPAQSWVRVCGDRTNLL
jgi:hypothetical protein